MAVSPTLHSPIHSQLSVRDLALRAFLYHRLRDERRSFMELSLDRLTCFGAVDFKGV